MVTSRQGLRKRLEERSSGLVGSDARLLGTNQMELRKWHWAQIARIGDKHLCPRTPSEECGQILTPELGLHETSGRHGLAATIENTSVRLRRPKLVQRLLPIAEQRGQPLPLSA